MRTRALAGWLALLTVAVMVGGGCHPGDIEDLEELDVVATFYDQDVDFGSYATFAMEDTVYNLNVLRDPFATDNLDRRYDAEIIAQVKAELEGRGYTLVGLGDPHDLRLGLGAYDVEGTLFYTYFPWWGYQPGYWYPAWGTVDFTRGTLLVFMVDWVHRDDQDQEVDPIWVGGIDGVIEGGTAMRTRLERGIGQMFDQSPYLESRAKAASVGEVR